jgi:hypothetical protein
VLGASALLMISGEVPRKGRRHFTALFGVTSATVLLVFALSCGSIILIDPYSTGHFSPIGRVDIATDEPTLANAGRVRDP